MTVTTVENKTETRKGIQHYKQQEGLEKILKKQCQVRERCSDPLIKIEGIAGKNHRTSSYRDRERFSESCDIGA